MDFGAFGGGLLHADIGSHQGQGDILMDLLELLLGLSQALQGVGIPSVAVAASGDSTSAMPT